MMIRKERKMMMPIPRFILLLVFTSMNLTNLGYSCPPSERAALLAIKSALKEPYLRIFDLWVGDDCCNHWYGVSCDPTSGAAGGRVSEINLRGESEDPILHQSGRSSGYMTGSISHEVCSLGRLNTLIVADWKGISGGIPSCISSTTVSELRVLELVGNRLTGQIPSGVGSLSNLKVLNLADNLLTGAIPPSIAANLGGSLTHLDLRNNRLTGEIPSNIGNLGLLSRALLGRNQFTGSIPNSVSKLYRLADLDLSMNQLSDSIPDGLGRMMPVLSTLNLDGNGLSGPIPSTLLSNAGGGLSILNLSRNSLEGPIPDVFHSKTYFTALDLSYNELRGSIPKSLSSAAYIGHLDLSHNHLCGAIPEGSPFDRLEASSFQSNDCLCGSPLRLC